MTAVVLHPDVRPGSRSLLAGVLADLADDDGPVTVELATSSASLDSSPRSNWVEESGGLPPGVRKVARALMRRGMSKRRAIKTAISRSKVWAAGGSAKGARNVAQWEALRARNAARMARKTVAAAHPAGRAGVIELAGRSGVRVAARALDDGTLELAVTSPTGEVIELARYVRTARGATHFRLPIGAEIQSRAARQATPGKGQRRGADYVRAAMKARATREANIAAGRAARPVPPARKAKAAAVVASIDGGPRPDPDMSNVDKLTDAQLATALATARTRERAAYVANQYGQVHSDRKLHRKVLEDEQRRRAAKSTPPTPPAPAAAAAGKDGPSLAKRLGQAKPAERARMVEELDVPTLRAVDAAMERAKAGASPVDRATIAAKQSTVRRVLARKENAAKQAPSTPAPSRTAAPAGVASLDAKRAEKTAQAAKAGKVGEAAVQTDPEFREKIRAATRGMEPAQVAKVLASMRTKLEAQDMNDPAVLRALATVHAMQTPAVAAVTPNTRMVGTTATTADRLARTPKTRLRATVRDMDTRDLREARNEFAHRATALGKPGQRSQAHLAVLAELKDRDATEFRKAAAAKDATAAAAAPAPPPQPRRVIYNNGGPARTAGDVERERDAHVAAAKTAPVTDPNDIQRQAQARAAAKRAAVKAAGPAPARTNAELLAEERARDARLNPGRDHTEAELRALSPDDRRRVANRLEMQATAEADWQRRDRMREQVDRIRAMDATGPATVSDLDRRRAAGKAAAQAENDRWVAGEASVLDERRRAADAVRSMAGRDARATRGTAENVAARQDALGKANRRAEVGLPFDTDDSARIAEARAKTKDGGGLFDQPATGNASPEDGRRALAARQEQLRRERAAHEARDAELNNERLVAGRPRGLGDGPPAAEAQVSGMTFRRNTAPTYNADAETYRSADGTVTLHQGRQDGRWLARESGIGGMGARRHDTPEAALAEVTERRERNERARARGAEADRISAADPAARRDKLQVLSLPQLLDLADLLSARAASGGEQAKAALTAVRRAITARRKGRR